MARTIDLTGKVALVTGGGRGIGKAIAVRLADAGAGVVIASRKKENLDAAAAELAGLAGKVVPIVCHLGKADQIEALVKETESRLGPVDILVNNSATNVGQGPALEVTDDMLDKMIEINIKAALRLIRLTVPKMIERGKGGSIINVSSISGLAAAGRRPALQLHQGGPDHDDPIVGTRVRQARHPRQRAGPGPDPDRLQRVFLGRRDAAARVRERAADRQAGPARRCRGAGALSRFRRVVVCHRPGVCGGRWADGVSAAS